MLLAVAGAGLVQAIVVFLGVMIVFGILWWVTGYLVSLWGLPDIVTKVVYSLLILVLIVFLIDLVMTICGGPRLITW